MDILKRRDETHYQVTIQFKPRTERQPIDCLMPRTVYRRMLLDHVRGKTTGTYEMVLDGHVTEFTFPPQDIDVILALPELKFNGDKSGGNTSE